jgi:DNA-binding transcriptional MerR regulator
MLGHLHSHRFGKMSVPGEFLFPFHQHDTKSFCCEPSDLHGSLAIQGLAETVNAWCRDRALQPANGQTASELSARTLHYYRSEGLLDAPESGAGRGYGRRHLLQLKAIRILQAQGLPLSRIQQLLFARSDEELEQIAESLGNIDPGMTNVRSRTFDSRETWTVYPLNEEVFVVARNGALPSTSQLKAIGKICDAPPKKSSKSTLTR